MSTSIWPKLSKSPVVEGLIDIHVQRSQDATIEVLKAACDELAAEFPSRQERRMLVTQLDLSSEAGASSQTVDEGPDGVVMRSTDGRWVAQFRLDGFTVSRLRPYGTWTELRDKAKSLWATYALAAKPQRVVRIASRFINRIEMPPGKSFEQTFLTNFVLGASLPQAIAGYLLRVVIPFEQCEATAILTQSLDGGGSECVLDLDAFAERALGISEDEMWSRLDALREIKNNLFFGSLTEAALERFK